MKLPYLFTAKGREEVSKAHETVRAPHQKKAARLIEAKRIIFRDRLEKLVMLVAGVLAAAGGSAYFFSQSDSGQKPQQGIVTGMNTEKDAPLELADRTLLDRSIIRIGVRSSPEEKERMRNQIKRALAIVLADPQVAEAYAKSETTEQMVVPHLLQALRDLANLYPDKFGHLDLEKESAHGDAYTVAIESRGNDGRLLGSKNFMMLRAELLQPDKFPQLLFTLDHECRHLMFRGMNLSRSEEEKKVYASSIARMQKVARALQKRGGEDAEIGRRILEEALPVHIQRLNSWQEDKQR